MNYRELKSAYDENLAQWKNHEQQALQMVEGIHKEFLYYLGIREEDRLLSIAPYHHEEMLAKTDFAPADCLAVGTEGQVGAAFRLAIGEDAYFLRFEMTKDDECWILSPVGESEEYSLPANARKDQKDELIHFFNFLTESLSEWIREEWDLGSTDRKHRPHPVDFIVDEKLLKAQFAAEKTAAAPARQD